METTQETPIPEQTPTPEQTPKPVQAPAPVQTPKPVQAPAPVRTPVSQFDGRTIQLIGWRLLGLLLSAVTLGIGTPWAMCMIYRWETKHTLVEGKRLRFDGKGIQLLGKFLLWGLLITVTLGIYLIFLPVRFQKWKTSHTHFDTGAPANVRTLNQSSGSGWAVAAAILAVLLVVSLVGGAALLYTNRRNEKPSYDPLLDHSFPDQFIIHYGGTSPTEDVIVVQGELWYVNNPSEGLNVRSGPDVGYEKIRNMPHGTQVYVLSWENGWAFIGDGWCAGNFLSQDPPAGTSQGGTPPQSITTSGDPRESLTAAPPADSSIVGNWMFITSCSGPGDNMVEVVTFQFFDDGTFAALSRSSHLSEDNAGNPRWYTDTESSTSDIVPRAAWCGTYTYDGNALALHYLHERRLGSTRWYGVDQQLVLYASHDQEKMYLGNPELIHYYPFEVPLDQTIGATPYLHPLPGNADLHYDPNDLLLSYLGT